MSGNNEKNNKGKGEWKEEKEKEDEEEKGTRMTGHIGKKKLLETNRRERKEDIQRSIGQERLRKNKE